MENEELWYAREAKPDFYNHFTLERVVRGEETKYLITGNEPFEASVQMELQRKDLKDLHDAIEHELYPERYLPPTTKPIIWDERPNKCPVCHIELKSSRYREDGYFCPKHHGKTFTFVIDDKTKWGWYTLPPIKSRPTPR